MGGMKAVLFTQTVYISAEIGVLEKSLHLVVALKVKQENWVRSFEKKK